jgi:cell division protein FtsW (lipid II flippase)
VRWYWLTVFAYIVLRGLMQGNARPGSDFQRLAVAGLVMLIGFPILQSTSRVNLELDAGQGHDASASISYGGSSMIAGRVDRRACFLR